MTVALGWLEATPSPNRLIVHPAPGLATEMVQRLLPHYVETHGDVIGIPGLRMAASPSRRDPHWTLNSLGIASICVTADPDHPALPDRHPDDHPDVPYRPLWHRPTRHRFERTRCLSPQAWRGTDTDALIGLLSGVLRRTYLVDQLWAGCDFNPYTHNRSDLIVEWCCGPSLSDRVDLWLDAGLDLELDRYCWSDPGHTSGEAIFSKPAHSLVLRRRGSQCRRTLPHLIGRPGA